MTRVIPTVLLTAAVAAGCAAAAPGTTGAAPGTTTSTGPIAAPSGSVTAGVPIPSDFPLIGSWTTSITKDDLRAAGITDPQLLNENSGRFTWRFMPDGTWTTVQESLDGSLVMSPVFGGHFTVDGQDLVVTTEYPTQYRDQGLHYRWTSTNGRVRFDILDPPDPMLPVIVEAHEWTAS